MINDSKKYDKVIANLCQDLYEPLSRVPNNIKEKIEEIRLRNGRPLTISHGRTDYLIDRYGQLVNKPGEALLIDKRHIDSSFQLISNYSVYAYGEEIRQGYITIRGGHRVGLAGKVVYGAGGIENIKDISSLNIRIAKEKPGISNQIIPKLFREGDFCNSLIISPPQCGKTTLLRDIIRNLSNQGYKLTIVDERSELAGMYNGLAQNDIGPRTDVLDGCLKADGIMMAIRALSPHIIAVDEIGSPRDVEAINEALRAGIKLIATIHGASLREIMERKSMEEVFRERIFERVIIMDRSQGVGTIKEIICQDRLNSIDFHGGD